MTFFRNNCLLLLLLFSYSYGLYEDQIGKFDWRQQYIGRVSKAFFDRAVQGKRIIVGTDQNVVAALQATTGKIQWRHILGPGPKGKLHDLLPLDNGKLVVVSGIPLTLKIFDSATGLLVWDLSLAKESLNSVVSTWSIYNNEIIAVDITKSSSIFELVLVYYNSANGGEVKTSHINLPWFTLQMHCDMLYPHLLCFDKEHSTLNSINVETEDSHKVTLLSDIGISNIDSAGVVGNHDRLPLFWIKTEEKTFILQGVDNPRQILTLSNKVHIIDTVLYSEESASNQYIMYMNTESNNYNLLIYDIHSERHLEDSEGRINLLEPIVPEFVAVNFIKKQKNDYSYRFLISASDHSLSYGSATEIYWTREESLASILSVEMVDLPVSETEQSIEEEFGSDNGGIFRHVLKRIGSQFWQLMIAVREIIDKVGRVREIASSSENVSLVRDRFGLHKLIIAVTGPGKIFGIDTLTGRIVWRRLLKGISTDKLLLFVQRNSVHYPLEPQCTILAKKSATESVLFVFHPITGQPLHGDGYIHLNYVVQQAVLIPQSEETEYMKPLIVLDNENQPHVFPDTDFIRKHVINMADRMYIFTADVKSCILRGYSLFPSSGDKLAAMQIWQLQLCSTLSDSEESNHREEIGTIVSKHPEERVHSQGRVLADRSVLFKYLNPNMVVITVEGSHPHHRGYLNVYLVDVVSGSIVFSTSHRRVLGPIHVVHAENWVVYSFFNEKFRRTEIVSLELFEGKVQSNTTAFSSFSAPHPLVDRQAYIYPTFVTAMTDTFSEKGMTAKHLLLGLSNGWIQELPRIFLDPRRPLVAAPTPEMREEGILPYLPELPIPPEAIINYNQTVAAVKKIYTAPSALESTCLVFASGLDIFFTHVTPSRTFDVLKDDFEYFFIAVVLVGLTLASIVTKRLASKKTLKQAWK